MFVCFRKIQLIIHKSKAVLIILLCPISASLSHLEQKKSNNGMYVVFCLMQKTFNLLSV